MKRNLLIGMLMMLFCVRLAASGDFIKEVRRLNSHAVELTDRDGHRTLIDFYGPTVFRLFRDDHGGMLRDPESLPPASILVCDARKDAEVCIEDRGESIVLSTQPFVLSSVEGVMLSIDRSSGLFSIWHGVDVVAQSSPLEFNSGGYDLRLTMGVDEYFYGGGVQNGRFSHRGRRIEIVNENSWTDGGVCSPSPFYWSTSGYGVLCHTFRPGYYDFSGEEVLVHHDSDYVDVFFFMGRSPVDLLNGYYELTGHPVLLPKFAFYEGHLNAYNRDYWRESAAPQVGVAFEDGRRYVESQSPVEGGIRESLNGGVNGADGADYQFSARAVVDRYAANDMPLGWVLPNDGYGAGYGQSESLDGNIANLKSFGDYARSKGVEIGLWTQSNLHPIDTIPSLLQRDIVKEVRDAGVRVLKTDVAWVGAGYSFGLNGIADVAEIMPYYGQQARPFIITLDGWAGTQRYAGVWTGDQTGGEWEYIRFHIPTFIGSGLSGQPNITNDMDGIFGGRNLEVNVRDFEWKTFTPMELNMDGWGSNAKYPQALGEPATRINRSYLKLKSMLLPYTYTFAHEAVSGKPLIRAMFLESTPNRTQPRPALRRERGIRSPFSRLAFGSKERPAVERWGRSHTGGCSEDPSRPSGELRVLALASVPASRADESLRRYLLGTRTQYQYLYGPWFLVAPIYEGGSVRNNIYLPEGVWYDFFSGDAYDGGCILNGFDCPLWKLPVFVRRGAIIPLHNPNNNPSEIDSGLRIIEVYPSEERTCIDVYDDDGVTDGYLDGSSLTYRVEQCLERGRAVITIYPAEGKGFDGVCREVRTRLVVNLSSRPRRVKCGVRSVKGRLSTIKAVSSFTTEADMAGIGIRRPEQLVVEIPKTSIYNKVEVEITGASMNAPAVPNGSVSLPMPDEAEQHEASAYTLTPSWRPVGGADFYEMEFEGMRYTRIRDTKFTFDELQPETNYQLRLRAVGAGGVSEWRDLTMRTAANPLEFAMKGLTATCSAADEPGSGIGHLFDLDDRGDIWHTSWGDNDAVPFTIDVDMHATTEIARVTYVPRDNGGNGNILAGWFEFSADGKTWSERQPFRWRRDNMAKDFVPELPKGEEGVRYMRMTVTEAVGGFGSGTELYVFRRPESRVLIPGDINQDGRIDENDLTSYLNYTGLRRGDSDFDGYVSVGDVNGNGLIDAQDISNVATQLEGGAGTDNGGTLSGSLALKADGQQYDAGDDIVLSVTGCDLQAVNALSLVLPYNQQDMQFVSIEPVAVGSMLNMTNDRLHSNGDRVLYPMFVNVGSGQLIEGSPVLFRIHMKALRRFMLKRPLCQGMIVDRRLNALDF